MADLERQLNRTSRNSSLPPSLDPPSAPPRPQKPQSGRSPGGQPGHEGTHRALLAFERVDEIIDHWPEHCHACARPFTENERIDAATPQRHQVSELPPIAVTVTEHRLHRLRCPECAHETWAEPPTTVPEEPSAPPAGDRRHARGPQPRLPSRQRRASARAVSGADSRPARVTSRDRLAFRRGTAHALGSPLRRGGRLPHRPRSPPARGPGPARGGLRGNRLLGSLVGL